MIHRSTTVCRQVQGVTEAAKPTNADHRRGGRGERQNRWGRVILSGWVVVESLAQQLKYTFRKLVRAPLFTSVAVLTLAVGIGSNAAIFSVVNGVP